MKANQFIVNAIYPWGFCLYKQGKIRFLTEFDAFVQSGAVHYLYLLYISSYFMVGAIVH